MKPTVFTILACAGSIALGACGTYWFTAGTSAESNSLTPVKHVSGKQTSNGYPEAVIEAVSAEDPDADQSLDLLRSGSTAKDIETEVGPTEPTLKVVAFDQKIAKRTKDYTYRSWRVDVANRLDVNVKAYVEVEWLDSDGFRIAYSNESRTLAPGVNVISDTRMFDRDDSQRVHSFRVTKINGQEAADSVLGLTGFKDKIGKRSRDYVYRSWRVDVVNNATASVHCYVEVEWLDADGHRVAYSNETRKVEPGVNMLSDTRIFDREENARIKSFRVVAINEW